MTEFTVDIPERDIGPESSDEGTEVEYTPKGETKVKGLLSPLPRDSPFVLSRAQIARRCVVIFVYSNSQVYSNSELNLGLT